MSKKFKVIYSPAANDDLQNIAGYILYELHSSQAAKNVMAKIRKEIRSLADLPMRYALAEWEPWASMQMRRVPVGNYVVFYLVDENVNTVTITRVFYGGRDIERVLRESGIQPEKGQRYYEEAALSPENRHEKARNAPGLKLFHQCSRNRSRKKLLLSFSP